ncbi:MAG: hypothetical protein ACTSUN_02865 [Promethearchaeota archaeon]
MRKYNELESRIRLIELNQAKKKDTEIRTKKKLFPLKEIKIKVNFTKEFLNAMHYWSIDPLEDKETKKERLLIEEELKSELKSFPLVRAVEIQKLSGEAYIVKLHAGRWLPGYRGDLLLFENFNSTELASVEFSRLDENLITKYTILRITKNRPLMLKEYFDMMIDRGDMW